MEVDKGSDKNQTCPTGQLRMHIWRMSLRRTKSTIISWHDSNYKFSQKYGSLGLERNENSVKQIRWVFDDNYQTDNFLQFSIKTCWGQSNEYSFTGIFLASNQMGPFSLKIAFQCKFWCTSLFLVSEVLVSDCRFGVSPVNYPDPDPWSWSFTLKNGPCP